MSRISITPYNKEIKFYSKVVLREPKNANDSQPYIPISYSFTPMSKISVCCKITNFQQIYSFTPVMITGNFDHSILPETNASVIADVAKAMTRAGICILAYTNKIEVAVNGQYTTFPGNKWRGQKATNKVTFTIDFSTGTYSDTLGNTWAFDPKKEDTTVWNYEQDGVRYCDSTVSFGSYKYKKASGLKKTLYWAEHTYTTPSDTFVNGHYIPAIINSEAYGEKYFCMFNTYTQSYVRNYNNTLSDYILDDADVCSTEIPMIKKIVNNTNGKQVNSIIATDKSHTLYNVNQYVASVYIRNSEYNGVTVQYNDSAAQNSSFTNWLSSHSINAIYKGKVMVKRLGRQAEFIGNFVTSTGDITLTEVTSSEALEVNTSALAKGVALKFLPNCKMELGSVDTTFIEKAFGEDYFTGYRCIYDWLFVSQNKFAEVQYYDLDTQTVYFYCAAVAGTTGWSNIEFETPKWFEAGINGFLGEYCINVGTYYRTVVHKTESVEHDGKTYEETVDTIIFSKDKYREYSKKCGNITITNGPCVKKVAECGKEWGWLSEIPIGSYVCVQTPCTSFRGGWDAYDSTNDKIAHNSYKSNIRQPYFVTNWWTHEGDTEKEIIENCKAKDGVSKPLDYDTYQDIAFLSLLCKNETPNNPQVNEGLSAISADGSGIGYHLPIPNAFTVPIGNFNWVSSNINVTRSCLPQCSYTRTMTPFKKWSLYNEDIAAYTHSISDDGLTLSIKGIKPFKDSIATMALNTPENPTAKGFDYTNAIVIGPDINLNTCSITIKNASANCRIQAVGIINPFIESTTSYKWYEQLNKYPSTFINFTNAGVTADEASVTLKNSATYRTLTVLYFVSSTALTSLDVDLVLTPSTKSITRTKVTPNLPSYYNIVGLNLFPSYSIYCTGIYGLYTQYQGTAEIILNNNDSLYYNTDTTVVKYLSFRKGNLSITLSPLGGKYPGTQSYASNFFMSYNSNSTVSKDDVKAKPIVNIGLKKVQDNNGGTSLFANGFIDFPLTVGKISNLSVLDYAPLVHPVVIYSYVDFNNK